MTEAVEFRDQAPDRADIVIVGGGFSGLMCMVQIARRAPEARIAVIERATRPGPGLAYGACGPEHLLNVPAARMGAFADAPGDFSEWLMRNGQNFQPSSFVPRVLYRDYLNQIVGLALGARRGNVTLVSDSVEAIAPEPEGCRVTLRSHHAIVSRIAVIAVGLPTGSLRSPYVADRTAIEPWVAGALARISRDDHVAVIGTGLTALDVLVSLDRMGHRGRITFVSRHGRFPLPHTRPRGPSIAPALEEHELEAGPRRALREVRTAVRRQLASGGAWQAVIDDVRRQAANAWGAWSTRDRARFLRHVRPFWEIHRHRAPRPVLTLLSRAVADGRVQVRRGSFEQVAGVPGVAHVVNCIGPSLPVHAMADPLVQSLLATGVASTDAAGLGLRADPRGHLIGRDGSADERLFLLGALRRGDLWETTAVPELRQHVAAISAEILQRLSSP